MLLCCLAVLQSPLKEHYCIAGIFKESIVTPRKKCQHTNVGLNLMSSVIFVVEEMAFLTVQFYCLNFIATMAF